MCVHLLNYVCTRRQVYTHSLYAPLRNNSSAQATFSGVDPRSPRRHALATSTPTLAGQSRSQAREAAR